MEKKKIIILVSALILVILMAFYMREGNVGDALLNLIGVDPGVVSLEIKTSSKKVNVGDEFDVDVYVTSTEEAINAVGYEISFDEDLVEVLSTSTDESVCELFPEDIIEENSVRYSCGLPSPGFTGKDGLVGSISLRARKSGTLEIAFEDGSQVLANDGLGTDLLEHKGKLKVVIK